MKNLSTKFGHSCTAMSVKQERNNKYLNSPKVLTYETVSILSAKEPAVRPISISPQTPNLNDSCCDRAKIPNTSCNGDLTWSETCCDLFLVSCSLFSFRTFGTQLRASTLP